MKEASEAEGERGVSIMNNDDLIIIHSIFGDTR